jgi:uncharacterized protein involved in type VI secretion and phage assembly
MPPRFLEVDVDGEDERRREAPSIVSGIVTNNCDFLNQGKVQVQIPSLCAEVLARITAIGAGSGSGFFYVPRVDDEVLVSLNQSDLTDAFLMGGVWNDMDRTPVENPLELVHKRVIRTGLSASAGHQVEFDDVLQSITITSSTEQQVTIDPLKIELKNKAGSLTITMDNATQTISLQAAVKLELKAAQVSIEGTKIELKGGNINLQSVGPCSIQGLPVKIN